jgi:hypothetical protein
MKKQFTLKTLLYAAIMIVPVWMVWACDPAKPETGVESAQELTIGTEDNINVDDKVIENDTAKNMIYRMLRYIKTEKSGVKLSLDSLADTVDSAMFAHWRDEAISMHTAKGDSRRYVPALIMTYGLKSDDHSIYLRYQPVCLHRLSKVGSVATYTLEPDYCGKYYTFNETTHQSMSTTDANAFSDYVNRYKGEISISRKGNTIYRKYIENTDVRSIIYPIKEMTRVMEDNEKNKLKLWNIATYYNDSLVHNLLLGPQDLSPHITPFFGKFGDFSHLCPPSCNSFTYALNP